MTKGLSVFLVCILISTALWFLIRLTGEFKETVIYPVIYNHPFKNKIIINQPDKLLSLTYKVKGFDLSFNNYLNKKKPLLINLGKQNLLLVNERQQGNEYRAEINTSRFLKQISEQLNIPEESLTISPDTVYIYFMDIFSKKVRVKVNLSLSFEKQFALYKPVIFKPDSITIYGTKRDIDKINLIETQFKLIKNLFKSEYLTLKVIKPKTIDKVNISSDKVTCFIPVEKFTEGTMNIPVTVLNNVKNKSVRTFPDKVQITYLVALSDYNKINPSMFAAGVDYLNAKEMANNKIKIQILNKPEFVKITKIKPDKVEFIIW